MSLTGGTAAQCVQHTLWLGTLSCLTVATDSPSLSLLKPCSNSGLTPNQLRTPDSGSEPVPTAMALIIPHDGL